MILFSKRLSLSLSSFAGFISFVMTFFKIYQTNSFENNYSGMIEFSIDILNVFMECIENGIWTFLICAIISYLIFSYIENRMIEFEIKKIRMEKNKRTEDEKKPA